MFLNLVISDTHGEVSWEPEGILSTIDQLYTHIIFMYLTLAQDHSFQDHSIQDQDLSTRILLDTNTLLEEPILLVVVVVTGRYLWTALQPVRLEFL